MALSIEFCQAAKAKKQAKEEPKSMCAGRERRCLKSGGWAEAKTNTSLGRALAAAQG